MTDTSVGIAIGIIIKGLNNISKANEKFKQMSDNLAKTGRDVTILNKKIANINKVGINIKAHKSNISNEFSNITETIAKFGAVAVPVKFAMDFESSMVDVKKYVEFESQEQFEQMGKDIKALSAQLGVNFSEISAIAASGGQQGLKASEIMDYTRLVSKFGVAFDMSGRDAGDAAAYVMNNFKLSVKELEKLGNQMNFLDDKMSMVKSNDLFNILNRTSSNANILGLSADATAALGATMLSIGKAPEVASTALNSMFNKLANLDGQAPKFHKALEKMGMDASYLKNALKKDANLAVKEFLNAITKLDDDSKMGVLTDMFGREFSDDIGALSTNADILNKAFDLIKQDSSKSLDEALNLKLKTAKSGFERLKSSVVNFGITIGNVFLPIANILSQALAKITNFIDTIANKAPVVTNTLFGIVGGFLAFGAIASVLRIVWAGFMIVSNNIRFLYNAITFFTNALNLNKIAVFAYKTSLNALKFTISGVSKAFKFLAVGIRAVSIAMISNPIGLILGGIALVAGLIIYNWDKVKAWFLAFVEWMKPIWEPLINVITTNFKTLSLFFSTLFNGVKAIFSTTADFMRDVFNKPVEWIKDLFAPLFDWLGEKFGWVASALDGLKSGVNSALSWVGLGDDKEEKGEKKSKWYNPFSWGKDETNTAPKSTKNDLITSSFTANKENTVLKPSTDTSINITFNGGLNIATNNGKFDLMEFENQIINSVKRALQKEKLNAKNTDIRG